MAFTERTGSDGFAEITFLYRLQRGLADASFGVWCARLAGLPGSVLSRAQEKADALRVDTRERGVAAVGARLRALLGAARQGGGKEGKEGVEGEGAEKEGDGKARGDAEEVARAARRLESALAFVRATGDGGGTSGSGTATPA